MTTNGVREIRVFIASPGDLPAERRAFKATIDVLNAGFADGAGVRFEALNWEDVPATSGRRVQDVINREVDRCDLFVLALHRRWGQDPKDDSPASSYTREEYDRAIARWERAGSPEVMVFMKHVDEASLADAGPQLQKVIEFRKELEQGRRTVIRGFQSESEFAKDLDSHLRDFARGRWAALDRAPRIELSQKRIDDLGGAGPRRPVPAAPDLRLVREEREGAALARAAASAAAAGQTYDATILFSKAAEGTTNLSVLALAADFFRQIGDTESAGRLVRRQVALTHDRAVAAEHWLKLVPPGVFRECMELSLGQFDPEVAQATRAVLEEVWGEGRLEAALAAMLTGHLTEGEILTYAQFLASPEGHSIFLKQAAMTRDFMEFTQREVARVLQERMAAENPTQPAAPAGATGDGP